MEEVLVTGANGFIGSHLAVELVNRGYFVYGLHRRKEAKNPIYNQYVKDGKIKGNEFRDKYMKPLEGIAVVNPQEKLQYTKIGNQQYGFTIVKSLNGKYNFVNHEDKLLMNNWVDNVNHFINYNGNVIASIQVNNEWFFINKDGKITNIL